MGGAPERALAGSCLGGVLERLDPVEDAAWVVAAPVPVILAALRPQEWLSAGEQERIRHYRQGSDRDARLAAWGLARRLIAHATGADAARLEVVREASGRPRLAGAEAPDFNISHASGWVAVGLARRGRIGVDAEGPRPCAVWDEIAADVIAPGTLEAWRRLPPDQRAAVGLRLWCVKEAVLKASGEGLPGDPRSVEVPVELLMEGGGGRLIRHQVEYVVGAAEIECGYGLGFALTGTGSPRVLVCPA